MNTAESLLQRLPHLSDEQLKQTYLNNPQLSEFLAQMMPQLKQEAQALRVVKLALEVNLRLGAQLAGSVPSEFHRHTVALVAQLKIPNSLKIQLLGLTRSDVAIPLLRKAMSHQESGVRRSAVRALGQIGSKPAALGLLKALNHENSDVRGWAAWALSHLGNSVTVKGLRQLLNHSASHVRKWAIWTLGHIRSDAAGAALLEALRHQDAEVRWRAASALGKIGGKTVVAKLLSALKDSNHSVRGRAASALGKIGDEMAVSGLVELLQDRHSCIVPLRATEALGKIGGKAAVAGLLQALNHQDEDVRGSAVSALGKIGGDRAVAGLLGSLKDRDVFVRGRAAEALGQIGGEPAVAGLVRALNDPDYYVRWRVAAALGHIGGLPAVFGLVQALKDEYAPVRQKAIKSLTEIGGSAAISALRQALNHQYSDVCEWAAVALKKMSEEAAKPAGFKSSDETNSQPQQLPKIIITSEAEASEQILDPVQRPFIKYLISIGSPGVNPPQGFMQVPHRLRLEFDDIDTPVDDPEYVLAPFADILKVIEFAPLLSQGDGNVLIHCHAGVSRSAAVALTVCAVLLGAGKEEEAFAYVLAARPPARPNRWIVELADEALGREGKLVKAILNQGIYWID